MKYKVAICDDVTVDREYVFTLVKHWAEHTENTVQINTFPSSESFLFHYADEKDYAHNTDAIREQTNKILSTIFV